MTHGVEILPQVRQGLTYSTQSISWLLMSWRRKEPGHQQTWYWLCWTELIRSPHCKGKETHLLLTLHTPQATVHSSLVAEAWLAWHSIPGNDTKKSLSETCIVRCSYNVVQYNMILHTALQWLNGNLYQGLNSNSMTLWKTNPKFNDFSIAANFTYFSWNSTIFPWS